MVTPIGDSFTSSKEVSDTVQINQIIKEISGTGAATPSGAYKIGLYVNLGGELKVKLLAGFL